MYYVYSLKYNLIRLFLRREIILKPWKLSLFIFNFVFLSYNNENISNLFKGGLFGWVVLYSSYSVVTKVCPVRLICFRNFPKFSNGVYMSVWKGAHFRLGRFPIALDLNEYIFYYLIVDGYFRIWCDGYIIWLLMGILEFDEYIL